MFLVWLSFVLLSLTGIALGQDAAQAADPIASGAMALLMKLLSSWEGWGALLATLVSVLMVLRGLADILTFIAVKTENNWDNKVANWVSQAAWFLGVILGKFGYSTPKLVLEEKADQLLMGKVEEKKSAEPSPEAK